MKALQQLTKRLEETRTLDRFANLAQKAVSRIIPQESVRKDVLSGTWLGHPLHPMLTDVVIGSWTSSMILDVIGGERSRAASDALVGVGILSALPTAASGLSDWVDTWGETRRVGLAHAIGNVAALVTYVGSFAARRRGARGLGVALGFVGGGIASATAYLGGHLVYGRGVGVDAAVFDHVPRKWTAVADDADVEEGTPKLA